MRLKEEEGTRNRTKRKHGINGDVDMKRTISLLCKEMGEKLMEYRSTNCRTGKH